MNDRADDKIYGIEDDDDEDSKAKEEETPFESVTPENDTSNPHTTNKKQ